jgi:hypothetical protein
MHKNRGNVYAAPGLLGVDFCFETKVHTGLLSSRSSGVD